MRDVYALGSCRLRAPLLHLHRDGVINLTNAGSSWYAHNSAECRQRIAMTDGDLPLPDGLRPLILNRDSCASDWDAGVSPIVPGSIGMFEISTRMQQRLDPYVLHSTCVTKLGFAEARVEVMPPQTLTQDVEALCARFETVVLVGNIALSADMTTPDPHRTALNTLLQSLSEERPGLGYTSPNGFLNRGDPAADLVDHNHFQPSFERRLAGQYGAYLAALPQGRLVPQSLRDRHSTDYPTS